MGIFQSGQIFQIQIQIIIVQIQIQIFQIQIFQIQIQIFQIFASVEGSTWVPVSGNISKWTNISNTNTNNNISNANKNISTTNTNKNANISNTNTNISNICKCIRIHLGAGEWEYSEKSLTPSA